MVNDKVFSFEEVVLSAFFHDIGKFAQRTGDSRYEAKPEELYCPFNSRGGYFSHRHVLYTAGVLELLSDTFPSDVNPRNIIALASMHHNPDSAAARIISIADWISSGADRTERELENEQKGKYYEQPLHSIFSHVNFKGRAEPQLLFHRLRPLDPSAVMPEGDVLLSRQAYLEQWDSFFPQLQVLKGLKNGQYLKAVDSLMERFTWCIPSSTMDVPDISLYDHSVTTAAFAAVLYRYHEERGSLQNEDSIRDPEEKKFLLVSGDLSGIQRYIFDLKTTRHNAKLLRARSFELQILTEVCAERILSACRLPSLCRIMNAGGRFLLVLPNTESARKNLEDLTREIEESFLEKYFGEITLNISKGVETSRKDLDQSHAEALFRNILKDTAAAKQRKLQAALRAPEDHVLGAEYSRIQGNANVCRSCEKRAVRSGIDEHQCSVCESLVSLGGRIPKARFLEITRTRSPNAWFSYPVFDGKETLLMYETPEKIGPESFPSSVNGYDQAYPYPVIKIPYYIPVSPAGDVKTFEDLAGESDGICKLMMLKADVDNLGAIFSFGFSKRVSISRYAALSRMINYFFSTFLNARISGDSDFRSVYTVFSGGDDLCLIGPWDRMMRFAGEIHKDFSEYTCRNPSLSISAGAAFADSSLPVRTMADKAEDQLELSKRGEKNRVTVFDTSVPWSEFRELLRAGEELFSLLEEGTLSGAFVYRLLGYFRQDADLREGKDIGRNALWRSHLRYDLARNVKKIETREWLVTTIEKHIGYLNIAIHVALYRTRKKGRRME